MTSRTPATASATASKPSTAQQPGHPTRLPGSVSSLKVQLSASELLRQQQQRQPHPAPSSPSPSSSSYSFTTPQQLRNQQRAGHLASTLTASIQPTDVQLLATSILGNQQRQRLTLEWSEKLINLPASFHPAHTGAGRGVSRETLKRALTFLSPSSWLNVLDERYLAGSCPYPSCDNAAPAATAASAKGSSRVGSSSSSSSSNTASARPAQYRISLKSRTVSRNTAEDPGDRQTFCSQRCWKRSQWVRQWVLKDRGEIAAGPDLNAAGNATGDQGGRFERLMDQDAWREIELLEDLEESGEMQRLLARPEEAVPQQQEQQGKGPLQDRAQAGVVVAPPPKSSDAMCPATAPAAPSDARKAAKDQSQSSQTPKTTKKPASKVDYDTDLPSFIGARFHGQPATTDTAKRRPTLGRTSRDDQNGKIDEGHDDDDDDDEDADLVLGLTSSSRNMGTKRGVQAILATSSRAVDADAGAEHDDGGDDDDEGDDEAEVDPEVLQERRQTQRMLDEALQVRRQQRELGLLD
ncbi:uncharacterized protein PFL1_05051 [Pseudozyma flocculosa PF-1]|uniref:RNA polymerase II subunit B1 CTD phosphatase RPAP2 homolog n=1 Tax=Pseudozyma flocculosa PF-1 TaxID=1277687 RepID=A0A061H4L4_9BASI|nr:uncharacterized protein PFL1_05051 [Pseudozyma flocculosa PF-1]EPQ27513.1 hypothetical protein PFL1_05051 [Pseudozyma flocculosa PF-1]